jgi:uncharacterized protein
MDIKYYQNAADFLADTGKYLAADEVRNGRILSMAGVVRRFPQLFVQEDLWFCSINTGKEINAVAISTRARGIMLGYFTGGKKTAAEKLVMAASNSFKDAGGVNGEKEIADIFAGLWCQKNNRKILSTMEQRLFRLDKLNDVPMSPGKLRTATMEDIELVEQWSHAFSVDVEGGKPRNMGGGNVTPAIENGFVFFWVLNGKPVSMAFKVGPTANGMGVSHVYTPPELRGKGYATSSVAELSCNILRSGKQFCYLYTDLANPTSNSIYMKIGYYPVEDCVSHAFGQ